MLDWFQRIACAAAVNLFFAALLVVFFKACGAGASDAKALGQLVALPALLFGFGGTVLSVVLAKEVFALSHPMSKVKAEDGPAERWLVEHVAACAARAGVPVPEVAIYQGAPNAVCVGAFQSRLLVAVSTGLLAFPHEEVEAIIGHELSHAKSGDGATLAVIGGAVGTFTLALSWLFGGLVDLALKAVVALWSQGRTTMTGWPAKSLVELVVSGVAMAGYFAVSRSREFAADAEGVRLAACDPSVLMSALARLEDPNAPASLLPSAEEAYGTVASSRSTFSLFSTHPPTASRIAALDALPR